MSLLSDAMAFGGEGLLSEAWTETNFCKDTST